MLVVNASKKLRTFLYIGSFAVVGMKVILHLSLKTAKYFRQVHEKVS